MLLKKLTGKFLKIGLPVRPGMSAFAFHVFIFHPNVVESLPEVNPRIIIILKKRIFPPSFLRKCIYFLP